MEFRLTFCLLGCLAAVSNGFAKLTPEEMAQLPPPADHRVDFSKEIKPILESSCVKCHGRGKQKGDFRIDDRTSFLKGGESGPAVLPGQSARSYLIELVSTKDPDTIMPKKGSHLNPKQIGLLRAWIDQDLPWDKNVTFAKVEPPNLKPRSPALTVKKGENPIDTLLKPYFRTNQVQNQKLVDDRVFARRAYLDIVGLLPPATELEAFLNDKTADKRTRLTRDLLSRNHAYAQHWLTFWNDALRNDYRGTGYIDGGRKQITAWLYSALATNMSYNQFVSELVDPTPESEGFAKGIVWRGVVNASQVPPMQAAQNISQVFMGINLKCASCHDSFINDWTLADAYGLANIYADEPLQLFQCDKPTGEKAATRFLYPELGPIAATTNKHERLQQLARVITSRENGRLSRTFVNRVWARLMGRGLVEPVDDMERPAWSPDLLDWLSEDFVRGGYDAKKLIETIVSSRAYQMTGVNADDLVPYVFRGPLVRRMSAEQFRDALTTLTGQGYAAPAAEIDFSLGRKSPELPVEPKWIWNNVEAARKAKPAALYLRRTILLPQIPAEAHLIVACDNHFTLYVNGEKVGSGMDYSRPTLIDIRSRLKEGTNLIAVAAVNDPAKENAKEGEADNPAGFLLYGRLRQASGGQETTMDFTSDNSWIGSEEKEEGWEKPVFAADHWKPAVEVGNLSAEPWKVEKKFRQMASSIPIQGKVRAALVPADPLMVALGRPNREQVVTSRPAMATTLQALELTNGETLTRLVQAGAERWINSGPLSTPKLVQWIYDQSLSRTPTANELQLARELIGEPAGKTGLQDFLWAIVMLPEFQLIY